MWWCFHLCCPDSKGPKLEPKADWAWEGRTGLGDRAGPHRGASRPLASCCSLPVLSFQELSAFPREAGGSGAGLHPVVYPCTALLLLCLFSTIITYILNHR